MVLIDSCNNKFADYQLVNQKHAFTFLSSRFLLSSSAVTLPHKEDGLKATNFARRLAGMISFIASHFSDCGTYQYVQVTTRLNSCALRPFKIYDNTWCCHRTNAQEVEMGTLEEIRSAQRAEGMAMILYIGTATPPTFVEQSVFPDYYFRVCNSEHEEKLKQKFKLICKIP